MKEEFRKITYWLYYAGGPIDAVRLPRGMSDAAVIYRAIDLNHSVPLHGNPVDHSARLSNSQVRVFEEENGA